MTTKNTKLVALPVQVIEISGGVVLKRGATEVRITGAGATEAVKMVLEAAGSDGASVNEIRRYFSRSSSSQVEAIIKHLRNRRLLIPKDDRVRSVNGQESYLDVFFWHFSESTGHVMERLNKIRLTIIGVNAISRQLVASLAACGHRNFLVFDHPQHRNPRVLTESDHPNQEEWPALLDRPQIWSNRQQKNIGDCLIVTSVIGGQQMLGEWNELCLKRKTHFVPILLKDMIGYVGPMIIPGETACYECLTVRQNSQVIDVDTRRSVGAAADRQGIIGFHPSMATVLGEIAAFEVTRFYGSVLPDRTPGSLLEVNLLAGSMMRRTVLKVPRCAACSPFHKTPQPSLTKILFTKLGGKEMR